MVGFLCLVLTVLSFGGQAYVCSQTNGVLLESMISQFLNCTDKYSCQQKHEALICILCCGCHLNFHLKRKPVAWTEGGGGTVNTAGTPTCIVSSPFTSPLEPFGCMLLPVSWMAPKVSGGTYTAHCSTCHVYYAILPLTTPLMEMFQNSSPPF